MEGLVSQGEGTVNFKRRKTKREDAEGRVSVVGRPVALTRQYSVINRTRTLESADPRFGAFLPPTLSETLGKLCQLAELLFPPS